MSNTAEKPHPMKEIDILKSLCLESIKELIHAMEKGIEELQNASKSEPSPNIDEHIHRPMPNHPEGGILNGWTGKFPFAEFLNYEGKGEKVKGAWQDVSTIRRNPEYEQKIKDFFETYKNDTKFYIFKLNRLNQENETLYPPKMGKKKLKSEIERLKTLVERMEKESILKQNIQLEQDLESVVKSLQKYGFVEMNQEHSHSEESVRKTVTITLNC
jgi:hypothetical protein